MLTTKVFLKKTRRGKVIKIVKEHYLRDDIYCGSRACRTCPAAAGVQDGEVDDEQNSSGEAPVVVKLADRGPEDPARGHKTYGPLHYVVVDSNVLLNNIDVLEDPVGLVNVVVLQTVLQEVRHRSSPVYKRLRDLVYDPTRNFYIFLNEHHKDCYVERNPGESVNDRNDRAIRKACKWYKEHLADAIDQVVLVTDDAENRRKALEEDGVSACSVRNYVENLKQPGDLVDKVACSSYPDEQSDQQPGQRPHATGRKDPLYPAHLSPVQVTSGLKSSKLFQGAFYLSGSNYKEGVVNCESFSKPILIKGLANQNRAVNGDTVVVELLDKKQWSVPSEKVEEEDLLDRGDMLEDSSSGGGIGAEEDGEALSGSKLEPQPTGRVVAVVRRKWRQYCGMLVASGVKGSTLHIFVPAERKVPKVRIETRQASKLEGKRIVVAVDAWPRHSRYPLGHFVRELGPIGDKATENQVLLLEHDIPHNSFSEAVLGCLPSADTPWTVQQEDLEVRRDLRDRDVCSVDPPGCTDIDDALHCRVLPNGHWEVGVHIADVTHFVRPHTALDQEAARRSTTVYLTDRRIDMLPEMLSSNLCSLKGGVERFAFSCMWEIDPETDTVLRTEFFKSVIRSRKAMTYEEAQNKIDDAKDNSDLTASLRRLMRLSKVMKARRTEKGALVLASSEIRFTVDSETADPIDVQAKQMRDTNSMVEEFMLAANISAAEKIFSDFPECSMLRRHPCPPLSNFDPLVLAGKQCGGHKIVVDSGKALADSLDAAVDKKNPFFNTMLRMIATRCMMQAVYFASGTIEESLFSHYGLACPIYTHFTSPIRRYADVVVHRLLAASIGADVTYPALLDKKNIQKVANNINYRHRMAQYASRASVNLHTHIYFRNKPRDEEGYVLIIKQNAVQVLIPKFGLEGTLYLGDCKGFKFDAETPSQTCSGVALTLFMNVVVRVVLDDSNVQHEKLVLKLVEPKIQDFSVPALPPEGTVSLPTKRMPSSTDSGSTPCKKTKSAK